jgi:hypothetical protein
MLKAAKILFITFAIGCAFNSKAQLLTNLDKYRNQLFVNGGYYLSFGNYSVGWIHNEHVKFLKRDVAGILDFSFPLSDTSHTKFVFRKGFQTNIWSNQTFRLPVALISSSDKVVTHLLRIHNFVTDFFFNPGIYKKAYTVALDLDYKIIWFSHHKEITKLNAPQNNNWPGHVRTKFAAGLALGLNYLRFTYLIRGGYQQTADLVGNAYNFYAVFQIGYNCNFKKRKEKEEEVKK